MPPSDEKWRGRQVAAEEHDIRPDTEADRGNAPEVFFAFLKLGLTSFGGPIAHLGYFRDELVVRRRWLDDHAYADLIALCQFLPGPASSQVGFALGWMRAGPLGALCAFLAFTLPSALLLVALALGASALEGGIGAGIVAGLKIVAVAIVAQAVWGMAHALCPDRPRATLAVLAALIATLAGSSLGQIGAIVMGGLAGLVLLRGLERPAGGSLVLSIPRRAAGLALAAFFILLIGLPLIAPLNPLLAIFDAFYRAGALVFGGGHVVLPLLEGEVVARGWIGENQFLAGYGAAQAVPGPLFTFAAYLGALVSPAPDGVAGAGIALAAIFLPGFLLLVGAMAFWDRLRALPAARAAMAGANAAVVGILGAALYDPVFVSAITSPAAFALALVCCALLMVWKAPPWSVVLMGAVGGLLLG